MTMKAAQEMARKRWKSTSKAERTEIAQALNAARQKATTPKQRSEIARAAAAARWGKKK
jgi:hypothetical protein